jgi:hypothetical protein
MTVVGFVDLIGREYRRNTRGLCCKRECHDGTDEWHKVESGNRVWWYEGDTHCVIMFLVSVLLYMLSKQLLQCVGWSRIEERLRKCKQTLEKHPPCFQESKSKLWLFQETHIAHLAVVHQQMRETRVSSICSGTAE